MITIVTPVYNGEEYIKECIASIQNQQYSNYEHIIVDGKSTDNTLDIVEQYKDDHIKIISEKDNGMYDAIKKGFEMANGEIYAWLNADDTYLPWAFRIMNYAMKQKVDWCTCMNGFQDTMGIFKFSDLYYYKREWIRKGYYNGRVLRFIQQESTFWTRELFQRVNAGEIISHYMMAGDFALWRAFARYAPLYSMPTAIAGFRVHSGQKSSDMSKYYEEIKGNISEYKKFFINVFDGKLYNSKGFLGKVFYKNSRNVLEVQLNHYQEDTK